MTYLEAKQALASKLNVDWSTVHAGTNDIFTETDFNTWIQNGVLRAWDYKLWPFARKAKTVTSTSDMATSGYLDNPTDVMLGSTFRVRVAGKRYQKLDFDDFQDALEDDPNCTDKIWSDWETYIFINPNAYSVGDAIDLFGKKLAPSLSADADLLPFSPQSDNSEHSGNQAIVQFAFAEVLSTEKKQFTALRKVIESNVLTQDAYKILDLCWAPFAQARAMSANKNRSMLNVSDMYGRPNNRTAIGNFNLP